MSVNAGLSIGGGDDAEGASSAVRPLLTKRNRRTLSEEILGTLREEIVMGTIPPGTPLLLKDLSAQLGVSVSPIREALRQLQILGLVEHSPYRGTRTSLLTLEELQETYEIRGALESLSARKGAERFTDDDTVACGAALDEIEAGYEAADTRRVIHGNTAFHLALARAARSETLYRSLAAVCETSERYSASLLQHTSRENQKVEREGHLSILRACQQHDPVAAERAVLEHLQVFERLSTLQMEFPTLPTDQQPK